jgi:RimJ/RimL family protein N-acetyltransferase
MNSSPVRFRPFAESDFPRIIAWIDTRETLVQWSGPVQFSFPLTTDQLKKYLAESRQELGVRRVFVAETEDGIACGHIELGAIDRHNGSASVCRVFTAPEFRGRGIGQAMVEFILQLAFGELNLRRVDLRVYSFNKAAVRCYEKAGFVHEGCLKKAVKNGDQYWDTVLMAILREEWITLHRREMHFA